MSILRDAARSVKSLIDSWAVRFMEEMDYTLEANNADRFSKEMATHKSLGSAIKVPSVRRDMTTRYVLVSEWVEGEKASNLEAKSPEGKACLATLQARAMLCFRGVGCLVPRLLSPLPRRFKTTANPIPPHQLSALRTTTCLPGFRRTLFTKPGVFFSGCFPHTSSYRRRC